MDNTLGKLDNKYILEGIISQTNNSKIYCGYLLTDPSNKIAIKLFKDKMIEKESFNLLLEKINNLSNSNITKIINGGNGKIETLDSKIKNSFYLIEEYHNKGELFEYISSYRKGFGEKISKLLFLQILSGLNYYISQGLIFEKIKFDNILLDKEYKIKLTDVFLENIKNKLSLEFNNYDLATILFSLVIGRDPKIKEKEITKKKLDKYWESINVFIKDVNLSKDFINLFNKIILNEFNNGNVIINDDINETNLYERIMDDPWFEGIKIEMILSNENKCYNIVIDEFEKRYNQIKNNDEIIINLSNNFNDLDNGNKELMFGIGINNANTNNIFSYNKSVSMSLNSHIHFNRYFNFGAECIKFKKFKNSCSIKVIHLQKIPSPILFMTKIVKICQKISLVETNENKLKIYCTKNEDGNKLITKISIMKNENFYDLIIQKIVGNKFTFITFYEEIIDKIKRKD